MDVGKQIKYYRLQKPAKQEELAEFLGVSYQAVSKWETGASTPDISLLPQIAVYFGITIDELFKMPNEAQFKRIENMILANRRIDDDTFLYYKRFLEDIMKNEPDNVRAYEDLADLYNHRAHSDHEIASDYAKNALELNPNSKSAWVAFLEANNGACGDEWYDNHFMVIQYFRNFLKKNPGNFLGLYAIIENLLDDERYDEAVPYIEQMKKVSGREYQHDIYMGDVCFGKGQLEKAEEYWNLAVKQNPAVWQAFCSRADRLKKLGRYEEALADYETCYIMQETPRINDGLHSRAQLFEQLGNYKAAIQERNRIIENLNIDYQVTKGEPIDLQKRAIKRLKEMITS